MTEVSAAFDSFVKEHPYPVEYYNFRTKEDPPLVQEGGKYYRTGYAARLIHNIFRCSNFTEVTKIGESNITWGTLDDSHGGKRIYPHQKISHYNKTFSLGSKAGYDRVMKAFGKRTGHIPDFYPQSYLIPAEYDELKEHFEESPLWISKPGGGSRGNGIEVISELPNLPRSQKIIQKYVANPMLINGLKFDLRFYVSIFSLDPLRIYVHENGLVRLATEQYNDNFDDISNRFAHLTNFSINKNDPSFKATDDLSQDGTGNKWTHRPFWPWLKEQGFDPDDIRKKIEDAFVTVIIASREVFMTQLNHRLSFELFGFDVMLDDKGEIYILEVNVTPALGTSSQLDYFVKSPVVRDIFNMSLLPKEVDDETITKLYQLFVEESETPAAAIAAIYEYELTQKRLGMFRCIYPTAERVESHGPLLERRTKLDEALESWLKMNEDEKSKYLQENAPAFFKLFSK
ncbi:Tubulin-tyrosine ligase family protein [Tritrichomonas foetus]|uniref:Tubulin-tyrosine ligase family protein n=1 Tax=Tritrichomonas foetus TaxID=1144522 RepID=A0A1J4JSN4_9EUKA|nr:Tubulin-tyrosine ligase family protein [Tritrichomonas foetus]|eukprot:OHT00534.1 Tubulin-tyrosine ligase family protein [Tritrichomonas foetus]